MASTDTEHGTTFHITTTRDTTETFPSVTRIVITRDGTDERFEVTDPAQIREIITPIMRHLTGYYD